MPTADLSIILRTEPRPSDVPMVRDIVASAGFFSTEEIGVAIELLEDRLENRSASDYAFLFADDDRAQPLGFACFGRIAGTVHSFDLYWIAVHDDHRGGGIGSRLLAEAERLIASECGARVYVETSSRDLYEPTRQFYLARGYRVDAVQDDFYAPGDAKVTLVKTF